MKRFLPLVAFLFLLPIAGGLAQRQTIDLPDGWRFLKHDAAPDAPVTDPGWESVTVPHCYNALDGQNGKAVDGGYYRGPTWYQRALDIPADWKDRRVFIHFEAAFLVADVYLNGEKLGQHRGGFAAFCYELTDKLRFGAPNELRVRVDNARNNDVAPLSADFTMEGGLYRPVHLLVTDKTCITPLDYAGPGVYATTSKVSADGADVEVETKLSTTESEDSGDWYIQTSILKDRGERDELHWKYAAWLPNVQIAPDGSIKQLIHLDHPHLWNGVKDPYVYTVQVLLLRADKGVNRVRLADAVEAPLGLRTVAVDNDKGFLLNGQLYPIHGVNRHQEKRDKGWALTDRDHDQDFLLIHEMGATAVRLAHYQQAQHVLDLCDREGLLAWQEIPLVNEISDSPAFAENAKQQLTEMIRQCSNHPSILTWSTCNELYNNKTPPVEPLIRSLVALAAELDPTRTPAGVSCHPEKKELDQLLPWVGFNQYPGWYGNNVENFARDAQHAWEAAGGNRRIAITEYGAGANPNQHQEGALTQPKPGGPWHPEEWQSYLHARSWDQIRNDPHLWGSFVWAMFDFAVDGRNEGGNPGVNDKGMVTEDRKIQKDAFFFYEANWKPEEPLLYITSNRATERTVARTQIKAYTTASEAVLTLNGKLIGLCKASDIHELVWRDVTLQPGKNLVQIVARMPDDKPLHASCEWVLAPPAAAVLSSPTGVGPEER